MPYFNVRLSPCFWGPPPIRLYPICQPIFLTRLFRRYNGRNLRLRRLYRQELFSSLIFIGAAVLMFWRGGIDWVVLFIIATVLQVYTAILIPREEAKEKQQ